MVGCLSLKPFRDRCAGEAGRTRTCTCPFRPLGPGGATSRTWGGRPVDAVATPASDRQHTAGMSRKYHVGRGPQGRNRHDNCI